MVFGNSKLAHPACFPKPPEGSFSAQSALGERQKEGNGLGSLLPPGVPQTLAPIVSLPGFVLEKNKKHPIKLEHNIRILYVCVCSFIHLLGCAGS